MNKQKVALSSVFASFGLTIMKLIVGLLTGSMGILSEAAHSLLDLGAATITFFAVKAADQPADDEHPYGHAKIESISALIETGLLFLTSAWIIYEAVHRLVYRNTEIEVTYISFAVVILSIIIDFNRARALNKVAKETMSQALEADALHFQSDIYSSFVVLCGLILFKLGFKTADSFAAIGVSLFVLHAGYALGKRTFDVLIDTAPAGTIPKIREIVERVEGVLGVKRLRLRPVGAEIFVDLILEVNRAILLEQVDKITKKVQEAIKKEIPNADIVVHFNPIALKDENIIARVNTVVINHDLGAHNVEVLTLENRKFINFDLEVDSTLSIEQAHKKAEHLKNALQYEFGAETEINIHLDPATPFVAPVSEPTPAENERVYKLIEEIPSRFKVFKDIHNVNVLKLRNNIIVSFHTVVDKNVDLTKAHDLSHEIEDWMIGGNLRIIKVVCHIEPFNCVK